MKYSCTQKTNLNLEDSLNLLKKRLKEKGFGILTEIDIKEVMKEKLGINYENYLILGVCNPELAHKALSLDQQMGLMLPCNIIIYKENNEIYISTVLPTVIMRAIGNGDLESLAQTVEDILKEVTLGCVKKSL